MTRCMKSLRRLSEQLLDRILDLGSFKTTAYNIRRRGTYETDSRFLRHDRQGFRLAS